MSSLFAEYIKEREGKQIIESDKGFATFKVFDNKECYLESIYVKPEYRETGLATDMANEISEIAKEHGCTSLIGSVCIDDVAVTKNMKVLLAYNMQIYKIVGNLIFLKKDLGDK